MARKRRVYLLKAAFMAFGRRGDAAFADNLLIIGYSRRF